MLSSEKIIRNGQPAPGPIRPFHPQEAVPEEQSGWQSGGYEKVIRGAEARAIPTHTLMPYTPPEIPASPASQATAHTSGPPEATTVAEACEEEAAATTVRIEEERHKLLEQAHREAEQYLRQAREEAETVKADAYKQGFTAGEAAAKEAVMGELATVLAALRQAVTEVAGLRAALLRQAEADILTLAFALARKILHREVQQHQHTLAPILQQVLAHLGELEQLELRVNPADLQLVQALQPELLRQVQSLKTLTMHGDETVARGGCLLTSVFGEIDARLETQLEELERRLRHEVYPHTQEEPL